MEERKTRFLIISKLLKLLIEVLSIYPRGPKTFHRGLEMQFGVKEAKCRANFSKMSCLRPVLPAEAEVINESIFITYSMDNVFKGNI